MRIYQTLGDIAIDYDLQDAQVTQYERGLDVGDTTGHVLQNFSTATTNAALFFSHVLIPYAFLLRPTVRLGPLRVRALVLVR